MLVSAFWGRNLWPASEPRCYYCNLSGGVALIVWFTTNGMCAKNKNTCMWREQAIIEWSRRVISIVACCHGAKLCAYAARDFRSQHYQSLEILTLAQMLWTARVGVCCRTVSATTKTKNLHLLGRRLCEQPKLMYTYNSFHNSLAPKVNCISCRVLNSTWVPCRRGSNSVLWTCF